MTKEDQGEKWEHLLSAAVTADGESLQGQGGEGGANWYLMQENLRPLSGAQVKVQGFRNQGPQNQGRRSKVDQIVGERGSAYSQASPCSRLVCKAESSDMVL